MGISRFHTVCYVYEMDLPCLSITHAASHAIFRSVWTKLLLSQHLFGISRATNMLIDALNTPKGCKVVVYLPLRLLIQFDVAVIVVTHVGAT